MHTIFKEKEKKKAKLVDELNCEDLDEDTNMIPIYFTPVFKTLFRERKFIKKFLILELDLDESLEKQNTFYGKSILFNNYGPFVKKTSIILKLDRDKIVFTFAQIDYQTQNINKLYELSLNYKNKNRLNINNSETFTCVNKNRLNINNSETFTCVNKNRLNINNSETFTCVNKNVNYYRKIYEKGIYLDKKSLLIAALTAKSFKELYNILIKVFNKEETSELIKKIYHASKNRKIIDSWEKYQKSLLAK